MAIFFITDVFAFKKYTGNQLATFILDDNELSSEEMLARAQEINFSETTFIYPNGNPEDGYQVRIFTPKAEVDFAGHPTLGSAYIIRKHILKKDVDFINLNVKAGKIRVDFQSDLLWMKQIEPVFGENQEKSLLAKTLGLSISDIDSNLPVTPVSTGLPFTIVPLTSAEALKKAVVQPEFYAEFIKSTWAKGILVFCKGGYLAKQQLSVRVFVNYLGIPEDPATGSGNGCLAAYLVKNKYFGTSEINICTGQGYEMNRPSQLALKAKQNEKSLSIHVGGKVFPVADGWW